MTKAGIVHTTKLTADKYGRIQEITENGEKSVEMTYQDVAESGAAAKLLALTDETEGRNYAYQYGYNNEPVGWTSADRNGENYVSVRQIGNGSTKYSIGGGKDSGGKSAAEKYRTLIEYDPKKTIEPQIVKTSVSYDNTINATDDFDEGLFDNSKELDPYTWTYGYDGYGRLEKKTSDNSRKEGVVTANCLTATYTYKYCDDVYADGSGNKIATPLVTGSTYNRKFNFDFTIFGAATIKIGAGDYMKIDMGYDYDEKGRITNITETGDTEGNAVGWKYGYERAYTYNSQGLLKEEANTVVTYTGSVGTVVTTYEYDSRGRLIKSEGARNEDYTYYSANTGANSGKLKERIYYAHRDTETYTYEYDNYGNRKSEKIFGVNTQRTNTGAVIC